MIPGLQDYDFLLKSQDRLLFFVTENSVKGIQKAKDRNYANRVLLFIVAFINRATEYFDRPKFTMTYITCVVLINHLVLKWCRVTVLCVSSHASKNITQKVEAISKRIFVILLDMNYFTLKFHKLKDIPKDKRKFGLLSLLHVLL